MSAGRAAADPRSSPEQLFHELHSGPAGLSEREAERRLLRYGPNVLVRRRGSSWRRELARQLTHPLAALLWAAAVLAWIAGTPALALAIVAVVLVNAAFAFAQEQQAERAVEALERYLPAEATVRRDGREQRIEATRLVPGDLLVLASGDRVSADARLLDGALEVDLSTLTGEAVPVLRTPGPAAPGAPLLQASDLVFSGTTVTEGDALALVYATGMATEIGRIAALSQRVESEESPLEREVRRVARLIAFVAVAVGLAFLPLGTLAGLPFRDAAVFAVGLLVANVPEGLLPTITLALALGVRRLASAGALVKRLSAVETLGSTTVICTDKTGTLTENRMRVASIWAQGRAAHDALLHAAARCNEADLSSALGDPTELALLEAAAKRGQDVTRETRDRARRRRFHFDPALKLMSTVDSESPGLWVHTKGAPEAVLARAAWMLNGDGYRPLDALERRRIARIVERYAARGLRVLALAERRLPNDDLPEEREHAERDLCLLGVVAMFDPPRPEVPDAVASCRAAGIRIVVITGDHALTALEVARSVGIANERTPVVAGEELDAMPEDELERLLASERDLVFARASPEAKLRIADALRAQGEVVAMTGDGVNDAPALRRADIGVAMGRSGTDVAREAATMLLTDDNFATIVSAIREGRRVFANVRKFVFYIFVHATPEVVPFLVFALSGGLVPLGLTVLQILAIDLGTETLPALALGREPAEHGLMARRPRSRSEGVVDRSMLVRAWLFLGTISAALAMGAFLLVLLRAGWRPGDEVGAGSPLHSAYLEATTATFFAIVVCQVGTALAARTDRASLRSVGLLSNPLLLWGIAFELVFAVALVYTGPLQSVFGTAPLDPVVLAAVAPFPLVVWGADELRRAVLRRRPALP